MTTENDPVASVWKKEVLGNLLTTGLTRQERLIVVLYYYEEMSFKEIAASLGISESSIREIHRRLVERLKNKMETIGRG